MKLTRSNSPSSGRLALFELSFNRAPREQSPYLQGKENNPPKARSKSKPIDEPGSTLTKTTCSQSQKRSSKSISSKKSVSENKQTVRPINRAWKLDQVTQNRKKLHLDASKERLKLPTNIEEKGSIQLRKFNTVLGQMLNTKDDLKFCAEFEIFKDISKQYELGVFRQVISRLCEAYQRKHAYYQNLHTQTENKLQEKISEYKLEVKRLTRSLGQAQEELTIIQDKISLLKSKVTEKKDQATNTKTDQTSLDYVLRLEKKLKEMRDREYRFLKILKILQSKGVDFTEVKDQLQEEDELNVSRTNLDLIRSPNIKKMNLMIVNGSDDNNADNSVVNDSDQSSFDFAGKIPEPNFFQCKKIYKNEKKMDPSVKKSLKINMDALYQSESEQHITTV